MTTARVAPDSLLPTADQGPAGPAGAGAGGLPRLTVLPAAAAARRVVELATGPRTTGAAVQVCNVATMSTAAGDPGLAATLAEAELALAGGTALPALLRLAGGRLPVAPASLLLSTLDAGRPGLRHYVLGQSWDAVGELDELAAARLPGALVVGTDSLPLPPPAPKTLADLVGRVRDREAHVVWVGLPGRRRHDVAAFVARHAPVVAVGLGPALLPRLRRRR